MKVPLGQEIVAIARTGRDLDALLAGRELKVKETKAIGCTIKVK